MSKKMDLARILLVVALVAASGCSTAPKPASVSATGDSASGQKPDLAVLQGAWKGEDPNGGAEGECHLVISGKELEVHTVDSKEWYKGTFTIEEDKNPRQLALVITGSAEPKYVGKTSHVIYRMEGGTLTMTGNEPGNPEVPSDFDAPNARKVIFKRE